MTVMKQILCPVDLSECSRHAFDRAVAVARSYDAKISVLHVVAATSPMPLVGVGSGEGGVFHEDPPNRDRILSELSSFLAMEHWTATPIDYHVLEAPSVHKEIVLQAQRLSADLVVLGTHGRSGFDRLFLGSVAEKVLRTSAVPVMTVPAHLPDAIPLVGDPFRRILYATDFSGGSDGALRYAVSLAQHGAAHLTLVHVVEPFPIGHDPIVGISFDVAAFHADLEQKAREKLRAIVPDSIRQGCDTDDVVTTGKPYVEILRVAAAGHVDLIVLGVHGRNAVDRLVFGSTTEHLVRRASCPVLTVRTADRSGSAADARWVLPEAEERAGSSGA